MPNLPPIDWASINWLYVAVLAVFVFFSTLLGTLLSINRAFVDAVFSALLFAVAFIFWTYYPHGLPLPTSVTSQKTPPPTSTSAAPPAAAIPAIPNAPARPVDPNAVPSPSGTAR